MERPLFHCPPTAILFPFSVSLPGTQCYLHDTLIYRLALLSVSPPRSGILAALLPAQHSAWRAVGPPYLGGVSTVNWHNARVPGPGICSQMDEGPPWSILRTPSSPCLPQASLSGTDYTRPSVGPYPGLKRLLCSLLCLHPKGYGRPLALAKCPESWGSRGK